ncbi:hypothetical protein COHA_006183 [Chlorella ohadii]|uniref:Purple acid phosphatase n=1 Tax=Chlorella ohadii TaxID=2649997 RepID=A0AAD5H5F2_9CHLO|nr:hypothetical protein COHA_006183 [Chlorella ohadii]
MTLHDEIEIEDMDWSEELQAFTYQCPCGDLFQITLDELAAGEEIAKCPSCSLYVRVIYDPQDFQQPAGLEATDAFGSSLGTLDDLDGGWASGGSGTAPRAVRLAVGDSDDEMVVMWSSQVAAEQACVQLYVAAPAGEAPQHTAQLLLGGSGGSGGGSGTGQRYRYRCGSDGGGWSPWRTFRAKRSAGQVSAEEPAQLLLVGDMGLYNSRAWPALSADASSGAYDALLHVGDLAYDMAGLQGRRGAAFLAHVEPAAVQLPYMVVPGNHEWHANFSHYRALFAMPRRQRGDNLFYSFELGPLHVLVYNTEAFFWPDSFGEAEQRAMYEWMESDLQAANANRAQTPWILVAGHRPMYCVEAHLGRCNAEHEASRLGIPSVCPHNNPAACRPLHPPGSSSSSSSFPIEQLFHRYGVDLAVFGHVHDYERYFPAFNLTAYPPENGGSSSSRSSSSGGSSSSSATIGVSSSSRGGSDGAGSSGRGSGFPGAVGSPVTVWEEPRATVHVTTGAGGNSEMRVGPDLPPQGPCSDTAPWCAFQSGYAPRGGQSYDFSHSRLAVYNATHLRWQQYSSSFGRVVDEWWLVRRTPHGPFAAPAAS